MRKTLTIEGANTTSPLETTQPAPSEAQAAAIAKPDTVTRSLAPSLIAAEPELKEQHFSIHYGDTGHSFDSLIGPYLKGATEVYVEDPYVRLPHQIQNFVRFCETVIKLPAVKKIVLVTSYDDATQQQETKQKLDELAQSLLEMDITLDIRLNPNMHDREIRLDNGWTIKIGRGLDFFQKPSSWFEVGVNDLSLRKCLETKVDISRAG